MNFPHLALYYFPSCPFCVLVLNKLNQIKAKVELKNIMEDEESHKKLVADTGRQTVPCLYIDGTPMHESGDIVNWLEENKDKIEKIA